MTARVYVAAGHWLSPPAAASYQRCRAAGAPGGITDAGRTEAEQAQLWRKQGHLGLASRPNSPQALHQHGIALDLPAAARLWFVAYGPEHGWYRPFPSKEPWHFVYHLTLDRHLLTTPPTITPPREAQDMPLTQSDLEAVDRIVANRLNGHLRTRATAMVDPTDAGVLISQAGKEELDRMIANRVDERFTRVYAALDTITTTLKEPR